MAQAQMTPTQPIDSALARRLRDEGLTRTVEGFMDTVYYNTPSPFDPEKRLSDHFCRNEYYANRQKAGVDIDFEETPYGTLYVDEKFAIGYRLGPEYKDDPEYKGNLRSYSFELETCVRTNDGWTPTPGWFVNADNKTTHYMLLWFKSDKDASIMKEYDGCLIGKQTIKGKLAEEGIDYNRMMQALKDYTERGVQPPSEYSLVEGGQRVGLEYKGYKVTQSLQFEERPINLVIPKEKLQAWSVEMMREWFKQLYPSEQQKETRTKCMEQFQSAFSSHTPIQIKKAIEQMEMQKQQKPEQPDYSKHITQGTAKLLAERGLVSGTLYYEHNGMASQGSIKRAISGDRLLAMVNGEKVPIAQLKGDKWHALTYPNAITNVAGKTIVPMNEMATRARLEAQAHEQMIRDLQNRGGTSIQVMDVNHQPLDQIPDNNVDGMILKVVNPITHQTEGRFQYHAAINRFVALGNSSLGEQAYFIGDVSIISEREYMKVRAFADRFVDYTRKRENRYTGKTYQDALQYAQTAISKITSSDWQLARNTQMEEIVGSLPRAERDELRWAITHDGCVNAFVDKLMTRARFSENPDLFIACTQEENYMAPNHRLSIIDLARASNCIEQLNRGRYNTPSIQWTPESVEAMCKILKTYQTPDKQFTFEGPAPTWAMAAFIHACEPNKVFINDREHGLLDMQSVMYRNEQNVNQQCPVSVQANNAPYAATIDCHALSDGTLDLSQIEIPEIEPGKIVFIQGDIPPYAALAIGELYGETAAAVFYERADGSFICGAANHHSFTLGERLTGDQREFAMNQTIPEGQDIEVEDPDLLPV